MREHHKRKGGAWNAQRSRKAEGRYSDIADIHEANSRIVRLTENFLIHLCVWPIDSNQRTVECRLRPTFQELAQIAQRAGIDHVVGRKPAASRLIDSEPQILECVDRMRIRRDRKLRTFAFRGVRVDVIQIQPVRFGIDFKTAASVARRCCDPIHVDVVGFAFTDQAARWMRENRDVAVIHRPHDAIHLLVARQIKMRMHGGDDEVELGKARVRQVQAALLAEQV